MKKATRNRKYFTDMFYPAAGRPLFDMPYFIFNLYTQCGFCLARVELVVATSIWNKCVLVFLAFNIPSSDDHQEIYTHNICLNSIMKPTEAAFECLYTCINSV